MLEAINRGEYLINVDEVSYSRSGKLAYTLLPRRKCSSIINSRFLQSTNLIFVL